jgi:hypothetical protein
MPHHHVNWKLMQGKCVLSQRTEDAVLNGLVISVGSNAANGPE